MKMRRYSPLLKCRGCGQEINVIPRIIYIGEVPMYYCQKCYADEESRSIQIGVSVKG